MEAVVDPLLQDRLDEPGRNDLIQLRDLHGQKAGIVQQAGCDGQHQALVRVEQGRLEDRPQLFQSIQGSVVPHFCQRGGVLLPDAPEDRLQRSPLWTKNDGRSLPLRVWSR